MTGEFTITDLAYTAGFFDGEGNITIAKMRSCYAMSIRIVNTDPVALEYVNGIFGGTLAKRDSRRGNRPLYTLNWCSKSARDVLLLLLPYLRIKRRQAELAICFQDSIIGNRVDSDIKEIFYKMSKDIKH